MKPKEETFVVATIKIRKTVIWTRKDNTHERKNLYYLIDIVKGSFRTSFNEPDKRKVWKRIKAEVYL